MEEKKENWVDFKAVKEAVSMQMVLDHYRITGLRKVHNELVGPCPIHVGGNSSRPFHVNVVKNVFKCFDPDCIARGNVLDFVAAMEDCSIKDAALKLKGWFKVGESEQPSAERREGQLARLRELVAGLEVHREQINYHASEIAAHASTVEVKIGVIKDLVAQLDKGG